MEIGFLFKLNSPNIANARAMRLMNNMMRRLRIGLV
jgi:hypothetical protein